MIYLPRGVIVDIKKELLNIPLKKYCEVNNLKISLLIEKTNENVYIPNYLDGTIPATEVTFHPDVYVAELPNVNLIGNTSIIYDNNGHCIFDLPFLNTDNRWVLSCYSSFYIDQRVTCIDFNDSHEIIDEGIMLVAATDTNFYHYNLELLTKLCLFDEIPEYRNIPLIVNERIAMQPGFKDELDYINKNNRKIIYLKPDCSYQVNKLIHMSDLAITAPGCNPLIFSRYSDMRVNPLSVKLLHKSLVKSNANLTKRIFISRQNSSNHRLLNQALVEQIFKGFGYEIIYTEQLTTQEKTTIFSEAKFIAGVHGAGLTNCLFANSGATLLCIQPKLLEECCFNTLANIINQNCYYIDAQPTCTEPYYFAKLLTTPYSVDIAYLVKYLAKIHNALN